jgi:hypothetical protein
MRGWVAFLMLVAVLAASPARAARESVLLRYEAYALGLPVVSFDFRVDETDSAYSVDGNIRTIGVFRLLYSVDLRAESHGEIASDAMQPRLHEQVLTTKGVDRIARLEYPGDGTVSAQLVPADESGRPKPEPQQILDTFDPLSTILAISRAAARAGRCDGRFPVFDGRRRYDIVLTDEGSERIDGGYSYTGMARRCRAAAVKIAGFSFDQDYQPRANKGHVWLASPRPGDPALPVRIDFDGTWGLVEVRITKIEWPTQ